MYSLSKNVCVVPVIPVNSQVFLPLVLFMFLNVGKYLLIWELRAGYCLLYLSCGECDIIFLYFMCCSVTGAVWEVKTWITNMCLLSVCCFFVWFCILCGLVRACSCYEYCPMVCCACLPSVWCLLKLCWQCVCGWVWWSLRKLTLCLPWIVSSQLSCSWLKAVGFVVVCSHVDVNCGDDG